MMKSRIELTVQVRILWRLDMNVPYDEAVEVNFCFMPLNRLHTYVG